MARPVDADEAAACFEPLVSPPLVGGGPVLLAVSGGPDSLCLMHLAARWRAARPDGPSLAVATVDHGLRPAAAEEAQGVAAGAAALGLPHAVLPWLGPKPPAGLQERAREARYRLLAAHARSIGAGILLTAHHADDQAETVWLRLVRGSGLHGLGGMERLREREPGLRHLRPFLDLPKERLVATVEVLGLAPVDDPSNRDPRFARTRARALAPLLAAEGLGRERLLVLGRRARRADAALEAAADAALAACDRPAPPGEARLAATLLLEPDEIVIRVLLQVLGRLGEGDDGRPLRLERVEALAEALRHAHAARSSLRRSLGGHLVVLDRLAGVTIRPEGLRSRGRTIDS